MTEDLTLSHSVGIAVAKEIDGVEMGVLADGRSYLTSNGLARLCGVASSAISTQGKRWLENDRSSRLAQLLTSRGIRQASLYIPIERDGHTVHAYTDDIALLILDYYAFEATPISQHAQHNFRKLAQAGLRVFVYQALGYDPDRTLSESWRNFHDRLTLHTTPSGYFSVFKECADVVLAAIRGGLPIGDHTIPDISVGITWSKFWDANDFGTKFGARIKHDHNYPEYYPQAQSNPQEMWVYPVDVLGEFRKWMDKHYLPTKYPAYLQGKVKKGLIGASTAELLLAEVAPKILPSGDD